MLPSYNLFRSVDCPFDVAGLCYRPYCHYRHMSKPDRAKLREKEKRWKNEELERRRRRSLEIEKREEHKRGKTYQNNDVNKLETIKAKIPGEQKIKENKTELVEEDPDTTNAECIELFSSTKSSHDQNKEKKPAKKTHEPESSTVAENKRHRKTEEPEKRRKRSLEIEKRAEPKRAKGVPFDEDDPETVNAECLELFNSYKASHEESDDKKPVEKTHEPATPTVAENKRRVAHSNAVPRQVEVRSMKKSGIPSAKLALLERYSATGVPLVSSHDTQAAQGSSRRANESRAFSKRIAPASGVANLLKAKETIELRKSSVKAPIRMATKEEKPELTMTLAQTNTKGEKRVAHVPVLKKAESASRLPKPLISAESMRTHSSIPFNVRQACLDQLVEECCKLHPDDIPAAHSRAIALELDVVSRCKSKAVYINCSSNAKARLRKEVNSFDQNSKTSSTISYPSGKTNGVEPISIKEVHQKLQKHLVPLEILKFNCYPFEGPKGSPAGFAVIEQKKYTKPTKKILDLNSRVCERCQKVYGVDDIGFPIKKEECIYHHGRQFQKRVRGVTELKFVCCDGDPNSVGCAAAPFHVSQNTQKENNLGFVQAIHPEGSEMGNHPWDVIAIDCEMIYTTQGTELARVTVVGVNKQILFDELVKTNYPVLDYNTRFSGITSEMHEEAKLDLRQIQAVFLANLKENSILIGHSLESDLLALKLIHKCIVDTSIMFPHKRGLPFKKALRTLSSELLGKIIQAGENGHDSAEDARTALELVLWKLQGKCLY